MCRSTWTCIYSPGAQIPNMKFAMLYEPVVYFKKLEVSSLDTFPGVEVTVRDSSGWTCAKSIMPCGTLSSKIALLWLALFAVGGPVLHSTPSGICFDLSPRLDHTGSWAETGSLGTKWIQMVPWARCAQEGPSPNMWHCITPPTPIQILSY